MKDRIPTKPNRYQIEFEDTALGTQNATITLNDEPTEEGTPLNSATLCDSSLLLSLGLSENATPSEAMKALRDYTNILTYTGPVINGVSDSILSIGRIDLIRLSSKLYKLDMMCRITQATESTDNFNYGVNSDFIFNSLGIRLYPIVGGNWHSPERSVGDAYGYAATWAPNNQFWVPTRVYQTDGAIGWWPSNQTFLQKDAILIGTLYGVTE